MKKILLLSLSALTFSRLITVSPPPPLYEQINLLEKRIEKLIESGSQTNEKNKDLQQKIDTLELRLKNLNLEQLKLEVARLRNEVFSDSPKINLTPIAIKAIYCLLLYKLCKISPYFGIFTPVIIFDIENLPLRSLLFI